MTVLLVLGFILLFLALSAASALFYGWVLMLIIGGLHSFIPEVPALGYWPCVLIGLLLGLIFNPKPRVTYSRS